MEGKETSVKGIQWTPIRIKDDPDWEEFHLNLGTDHIAVWLDDNRVYRCACLRPNGTGMVRTVTSLYKAETMDDAKHMAIAWVSREL